MKAQALIERCTKVKQLGEGRWIACCPAHDDKHPSMTVRELEDGRVLVHCFAGCAIDEVLGALGLSFDALFPDVTRDSYKGFYRPFPAADVLCALCNELGIVALIAGDMESKRDISEADIKRLRLARQRIETGSQYALGLHLRVVRDVKP